MIIVSKKKRIFLVFILVLHCATHGASRSFKAVCHVTVYTYLGAERCWFLVTKNKDITNIESNENALK